MKDSMNQVQEKAQPGSNKHQTSFQLKPLETYAIAMPVQRKPADGRSGLPENLKAGMEQLSGLSMDHVKVHYNSEKPSQIQAHAYAQGSEIHLGPGQERHLPHEAWHVVQQAQGRVKPTIMAMRQQPGFAQAANGAQASEPWHAIQTHSSATASIAMGVPINADPHLEREADQMGARALQAAEMHPLQAQTKVHAALTPSAMQRSGTGVIQGLFTGFNYPAGGWALNNTALPMNLDAFPGGANLNAGGQQAGATARTIYLASKSPYHGPKALGGFKYFSKTLGKQVLYQPGGKAKRYTHLHVINGQTHGPGTPNNLTLGSTADNNRHRAQVEDFIRNGLPAVKKATAYQNAMLLHPPDVRYKNVAYWLNGINPVPGSVAGVNPAQGAKVKVAGVNQFYARYADPALHGNLNRWAKYSVNPNYNGNQSPTILNSLSNTLDLKHQGIVAKLEKQAKAQGVYKMPFAAANVIFQLEVTPADLDMSISNSIKRGMAKAKKHIKNASNQKTATSYLLRTNRLRHEAEDFGDWVEDAFPYSLNCTANLYQASFDPANLWYKKTEAPTNVPSNRN